MNRKTIDIRQFCLMMALFTLGSMIGTGGDRSAGRDTWISILCAAAACVPLLLVYARLSSLYPGQSLYGILYNVLGKAAGLVLSVVFLLFCLNAAVMEAGVFTNLSSDMVLTNTPEFFISVSLVMLCAWLALSGLQVMGRMSNLLFWGVLALFVLMGVMVLGRLQPGHMLPVMDRPVGEMLGAGRTFLVCSFAESVIFLCFSGKLKEGQSRYKAFIYGVAIGAALLVTMTLRNIQILGEYVYSTVYFPSHTAISMLSFGKYLQRIEVLVSTNLLFCVFIKVAVCIYGASAGVQHIFSLKSNRWPALVFGILISAAAPVMFTATQEIYDFAGRLFYRYALPIEIILPLVVWAVAEIRHRMAARGRA